MSRPRIILIGPDTDRVGGMSSVVAQMRLPSFAERYEMQYLPGTYGTGERESLPRRVLRHLRQIQVLHASVRRSPRALVHIHTCSGFSFYRSLLDMMVAQWLGAAVVLHIHGAKFEEFHAAEPAWRRSIIAWGLARADRAIALSQGWAKTLGAISPRARVTVVENAVEMPESPRRVLCDRPCRFLLLARMDRWKGVDDLLAACRKLRREGIPFELTLAGPPGTAGDHTSLPERISSLGLEGVVRYVGSVAGEEKSGLLAQADVYVQPSHHEGLPIAMLEALSYALPVVATRVGAVSEVIEDGHQGLLVAPHEPSSLAAAMERLIRDGQCRMRMAQAARDLAVERFGLDRFHRDLHTLYGELIRAEGRVGRHSPAAPTRDRGHLLHPDTAS